MSLGENHGSQRQGERFRIALFPHDQELCRLPPSPQIKSNERAAPKVKGVLDAKTGQPSLFLSGNDLHLIPVFSRMRSMKRSLFVAIRTTPVAMALILVTSYFSMSDLNSSRAFSARSIPACLRVLLPRCLKILREPDIGSLPQEALKTPSFPAGNEESGRVTPQVDGCKNTR